MIVLMVFFALISARFVQSGIPNVTEGESPVIHTLSVGDPMHVNIEWTPVISMEAKPVLGYKVLLWTLDLDNDTAVNLMEDIFKSLENAKEIVIRSTVNLYFEFTAKYNYIYQIRVQAYTVDGDGPLSIPSVFRLDRPEKQSKLIESQISGSDIMSNWTIAKNYYNTKVELRETYGTSYWDINESFNEHSQHNFTDKGDQQIKQPLGSNKNFSGPLSVKHTLYGTNFISNNTKGKNRDRIGKEGKQYTIDQSQSESKRHVYHPGHLNKEPENHSPNIMGYLPEYYMKSFSAYNGDAKEYPSIKNNNSENTSSAHTNYNYLLHNSPISKTKEKLYSPEYKIDYSTQNQPVIYDDRYIENTSREAKQNPPVYRPTDSDRYSDHKSARTKILAPEEVVVDIKTDLKEHDSKENQYPPEIKYEGSNINPSEYHSMQLKQHKSPEISEKTYYDYGIKTKMQPTDEGLINSRKSFIRPVESRQYGPYNRPDDDIQYTSEILGENIPKGHQQYQPYPDELKKNMAKSSLRPLPKKSMAYPSETHIRPLPDNLKPRFYEKSTAKPFALDISNVNLPKKIKHYPSENLAIRFKQPVKSHVNLYLNDANSEYRSQSNDKPLNPSFNSHGAEILYHRDNVVVNSNISNRGTIKSVSKNHYDLEKKDDNTENINNNLKHHRTRVFRPLKEIKYD